MKNYIIIWLCIITTTLTGCKMAINKSVSTESIGPYPYPYPLITYTPVENFFSDSYPSPVVTSEAFSATAVPFIIPTPTVETGVVIGQLLEAGTKKPYLNLLILANTVKADKENMPPVVAFTLGTNLESIQNVDGQFYFDNVVPGEYALAIYNPVSSIIITEPENSDQYLTFEVKAGEVTDLGTIYVK